MTAAGSHGIAGVSAMKEIWHEWNSKSLGEIIADRVRAWRLSFYLPNPWPDDWDLVVRAPDAIPVCHRCFTPREYPVWFCPYCGTSIGRYNNTPPFVRIYSLGEVLRSGVGPSARFTALTIDDDRDDDRDNDWIRR